MFNICYSFIYLVIIAQYKDAMQEMGGGISELLEWGQPAISYLHIASESVRTVRYTASTIHHIVF